MINRIVDIFKQGASILWRSFCLRTVLILLATGLLSLVSIVHIYTTPYTKNNTEISIPKGLRTWTTLSLLHEQKVIPSPFVTLIGAMFINGSVKIIAGDYAFKATMSAKDIMRMLSTGKVIEYTITFAEGRSVHDIMLQLKNDDRLTGSIQDHLPEGSLFPSTYIFRKNHSRQHLIHRMTQTMNFVVSALMETNANPFIKTPYELIIFASILEKEAASLEELPRIAGIFVNRLQKKMRLQSDPTVIYGMTLGKNSLGRPLNRQDLKVDSDYNTYARHGLPKTPICCPGFAALKAAAHPKKTDEFYFILDGKNHLFSVTYQEHLEKKRLIRKEKK